MDRTLCPAKVSDRAGIASRGIARIGKAKSKRSLTTAGARIPRGIPQRRGEAPFNGPRKRGRRAATRVELGLGQKGERIAQPVDSLRAVVETFVSAPQGSLSAGSRIGRQCPLAATAIRTGRNATLTSTKLQALFGQPVGSISSFDMIQGNPSEATAPTPLNCLTFRAGFTESPRESRSDPVFRSGDTASHPLLSAIRRFTVRAEPRSRSTSFDLARSVPIRIIVCSWMLPRFRPKSLTGFGHNCMHKRGLWRRLKPTWGPNCGSSRRGWR